jgi:chromosome segregation ATPase
MDGISEGMVRWVNRELAPRDKQLADLTTKVAEANATVAALRKALDDVARDRNSVALQVIEAERKAHAAETTALKEAIAELRGKLDGVVKMYWGKMMATRNGRKVLIAGSPLSVAATIAHLTAERNQLACELKQAKQSLHESRTALRELLDATAARQAAEAKVAALHRERDAERGNTHTLH